MTNNILLKNSITYQPDLQLPFGQEYTSLPKNDISFLIHQAILNSGFLCLFDLRSQRAPQYDPIAMFTSIFLCFAENGYASSRRMENFIRHDSRCRYLFQGKTPSHNTINNFINKHFQDGLEEAFVLLNQYIETKVPLDLSVLYVDGTKFEANANKFTFVWKKAVQKYRLRLLEKIHKLFCALHREKDLDFPVSVCHVITESLLMEARDHLEKKILEQDIRFVYGRGKRKTKLQKYYDQICEYLAKLEEYNAKLEILGNRGSYSKTDTDATFMHMKYDYYCNTGVFKPGYNVQIGVSDGFIRMLYVSSDASDQKTLIPLLENHKAAYGNWPECVCADAGYGSYDNYKWLEEEKIQSFIKPQFWQKRRENKKKDRFRYYNFAENSEGKLLCPEGHEMEALGSWIPSRQDGRYTKVKIKYMCRHCKECPFKEQCTPKKDYKYITKTAELERLQHEAEVRLNSEAGKEARKQRAIQAEGTFGQIKEDYRYIRLRRRGKEKVEMELYLVAIGHNLRKMYKVLDMKNEMREEDYFLA